MLMHTAAIDLSYADDGVLPIFKPNPNTGTPDLLPSIYAEMFNSVAKTRRWRSMNPPQNNVAWKIYDNKHIYVTVSHDTSKR